MPRYDLMHWSVRVRDQQAAHARPVAPAPVVAPPPVDGQVDVFASQGVDPDLIRLALVVAALQRERQVLAADRMNADIDLPQLSGQTVGEHLRLDDTDPGRGELALD